VREKCNRQNIDLKKGRNLHIDEKYKGGRGGGGGGVVILNYRGCFWGPQVRER